MMPRTAIHPLKMVAAVGAAFLLWGLLLAYASSPASAAEIKVNSTADPGAGDAECTLREAITSANSDTALGGCVLEGSGADRITFDLPEDPPNTMISLKSELLIASNLEISGPGATALTISGNNTSRVFFINPGARGATSGPPATGLSVAISNLTIANGQAKGGNGGAESGLGGGGAAGMGGAIFVNNGSDGSVTINGVAFSGNRAQGGNGGAGGDVVFFGGGGGGGVGGNGADGDFEGGAGGGGGPLGGNGGAGGADGTLLPEGSPGGNGGAGGDGGFGGGAGGGGASGKDDSGSAIGGAGGAGGFGGGGGGGGGSESDNADEGGAGGAGGSFGGAGGAGGFLSGGAGGGGAGLGGAIFIRAGSLTLADSSFTNNAASGGAGGAASGSTGDAGGNGQGKGGAIFVLSPATVSGCATFSGNSATNAEGSGTDTNDIYGGIVPASCNTAPTAVADSYSTNEDTPLTVNASEGVLGNDSDSDGDTLTAVKVSDPANGTVMLNADGSFSYTPDDDFNGPDSFTYKASDGSAYSNVATVNIQVNVINDAPSFTKGADQTVNEDAGAQSVSGWATNISAGPSDESGQELSFETTNNNNALFSVQPSVASNGTLTYTPAHNASGSATVSVTLKDNGGGQDTSATQTFTINVTAPTKADCKKGGWKDFRFPDQGTCITFVNENRP